jgi:ornithine carbamoyltransferase
LGQREPVSDVARVLSRYVDGIVARTFSHDAMESLARHATVPVVNGLTDREHPCQALSDFLTIYEKKGRLEGLALAFVGDGNNVARSLLLAASIMGTAFRIASPQGYEIGGELLALGRRFARQSGAQLLLTAEPRRAVHGADVVYTDVWASMGQEAEAGARRLAFADYQLTDGLLALAAKDVLLMHPLPAHHGEEVATGLLDGPQSVVFDQAENRLHLQKALLVELMGKVGPSP